MKIYSTQPWIWMWVPSLRKSEAKGKIYDLVSVPHGWAAQCAGFCRSHCTWSCAVIGTQTVLTEPVLSSSPPGLSREVWKSHPQLGSCQQSLSWKLCSCEDCMSSSPKANAMNLGTLWSIWWKCACMVGRPRAESKKVQCWAVVGWTGLD